MIETASLRHKNLRTLTYSGLFILVLISLIGIASLPYKNIKVPLHGATSLQVKRTLPKNCTLQVQRRPQKNTSFQTWSKYKSWENGLVTKLRPKIARDCKKIISGYREEISKVNTCLSYWENSETDNDLLKKTSNCSWVEDNFLNNFYTSKLELSFPIAFVFVIYNSPQQVVRLLKLLYRPHNQYCISPDKKSGPVFIGIFRNLAKCLDNVHIASTLREVQWGHPSIMESQMCCYKDLMKIREAQAERNKWKYVINLCGKELPLTTNHEIVSYLVKLNGTSMIEAELVPTSDYQSLSRLRKPVPYNISYAKSSVYMALSPVFIEYLYTNKTVIELYEYFKNNFIPEEHFFSTVYMLPDIPGGRNSELSEYTFIISQYEWIPHGTNRNASKCQGDIVHYICIVDSGDLSWMMSKQTNSGPKALFHNKYFMENDHIIMDCMEERIVTKNKVEYDRENKSVFKEI